jgi:cytochrome c oxidase subunit 2
MWSERVGILLTAAIVVLLIGATVAVYAVDLAPGQSQEAQAIDGRAVFTTKGCTSCHSIQGVAGGATFGPDLTGLPDRAGDRVEGLDADGYVRQSVLDPQAFVVPEFGETSIMPTLPLNTEELDALVKYLLDEA